MSDIAFSAVTSVLGTTNQIGSTGGLNPVITIANNVVMPGTGGATLPQGNTAARAGNAGTIRFNTQTTVFEGTTDGATWSTFAGGGGPILSVTGTALQIDVTAGQNPVISIDAGYVGQTSITTLGTISTGTWAGTTIAQSHGGTGFSTYTLGDILYSSASNVLSKLPGNTTSGIQYLAQTGTGVVSAAPVWTTISGGDITGAALTKTDDTNVTLTLSGTPTTALLRAAGIAAGWTGQLAVPRGGSGASSFVAYMPVCGGTTTTGALQSVSISGASAGYVLTYVSSSDLPTWQAPAGDVTSISGTANQIAASASTGAVTLSLVSNAILPGTGGVQIPGGTTAQRAGAAGTIRFNSQSGVFESTADGATWATIETSATGVISVSGTLNRITVTPTTGLCVVDISASYVGQTSITTLGTITTGVWNGSVIPLAYGGTNANLTASNGGIFYSTASAGAILAGTATANQLLMSGASTTPAWSTSTYPATNAANTLLYASSANTMAALATANNSILVTSGGGVPSLSTSMPSAVQIGVANANSGTGASSSTFWRGDNTWAAAGSSGALVLLSAQDASSSATLAFTTFFTSTYDDYLFEFVRVLPATDAAFLTAQLGTSGPTYVTTGYTWNNCGVVSTSSANYSATSGAGTYIPVSIDNGTYGPSNVGGGVSGWMRVTGTNGSANVAVVTAHTGYVYTGNTTSAVTLIAGRLVSGTYTAIKFYFSSGNIASGSIRMYGIAKS